ncbi:MAG TPA: Ldh family oxidoreductase [Xanthobacteraceae bacterium]|nr:Ldh family oxidoreductase [Xanthobacteraceae bacterium]
MTDTAAASREPEASSTVGGAAAGGTVPAAALLAFTQDALMACGLPLADAAVVAQAMVEADLTGVDTHGVARLPQYGPWLQGGQINPRANVQVAERGPATAVVDGDNGMGHLVMTFAARTAAELARASGVAWVGTRRSNHAGAGGVYAAMMLEHDMIGIYGAASSANHMAVWGGAEPMLGTNPLAFAIPAGEEAPVVLDTATSVSSFGVIRKHQMENNPIPEGWVISRDDGTPITDPNRASEGTLLPIGGHKGSGLALIIGLLAGPLNRAAFGRDVQDFGGDRSRETNTGQFIIALDVSRFLPLAAFKAEIDRHVRDLRDSKRLPGVDAIRIPGAERQRKRIERSRDGVALSVSLLKQLDDVASRLAVTPLRGR